MADVTEMLAALGQGAPSPDEAWLRVYNELRHLAAARMAQESPGQTLQATALVHEAYLRLLGDEPQSWNSRGHFFAAAAEAMRRILVERARRKRTIRYGGGLQRIDLDEAAVIEPQERVADDLIALDEALAKFAKVDQVKADLVKLRYFGGLTIQQAAEVLGISHATAERHWDYARSWLHAEIKQRRNTSVPQ